MHMYMCMHMHMHMHMCMSHVRIHSVVRRRALPDMVFLNGSTKPVVGWKWTRCLELSRMKYL